MSVRRAVVNEALIASERWVHSLGMAKKLAMLTLVFTADPEVWDREWFEMGSEGWA